MAYQICSTKWHPRVADLMIDGLVQPDWSSGDKVSDWVSRLLARVRGNGTSPLTSPRLDEGPPLPDFGLCNAPRASGVGPRKTLLRKVSRPCPHHRVGQSVCDGGN